MKLSKFFMPTLKEVPSEADTISSQLMIRSGMIRKLASGLYEWLPLGLRVLKKAEQIVREEMNHIGGQEVWLPLLLPKELWEETGRWSLYGKELFRIKDRKNAEFCLGPTHEEAITDIARREVRSYRELPVMFYQFGTKFRDEIRPRFGVMRAREFYMKDAYSFHATEQDAENYYKDVFNAYSKICERCGFKFRAVEASSGAIGGKFSHEFMVIADTGEEEIAWCDCGFAANVEKAECAVVNRPERDAAPAEALPLKEVHTPNMCTVEEVAAFLKAERDKFIKTLIYVADGKPVAALIRGDLEINETKLKDLLGAGELFLADEQTIQKVTGAPLGFAGPAGLKSNSKDLSIVADYSVTTISNAITGANKKDYHTTNVNIGRDYNPDTTGDIRKVREGDICPRCCSNSAGGGEETSAESARVKFSRGIEIGHTFKLGTKYSKAMNAAFLDADGKQKQFIMGCYGIGVSRIVAASIEQSHDANGIIWPMSLAPFHIIVIPIDYKDPAVKKASDDIYAGLIFKGYDVLLDDRDERPGVKFKDADLTGIPIRITVGSRNLPENAELKLRSEAKGSVVKISELSEKIVSGAPINH